MTYEENRIFKGYYSILQYVPNLERGEAANIGVLLFCPEIEYLDIVMDHNNDNIRRLFPKDFASKPDLRRINAFKSAFSERILQERAVIKKVKDFIHFIETRANQFVLTPPRTASVAQPEHELQELFQRLVEFSSEMFRIPEAQLPQIEIRFQFDSLLKLRGIEHRIERDHEVSLKYFGKTKFPYAYRNGRMNVIQTAAITKKTKDGSICKLAVEGRELLQEHDIQMQILASLAPNAKDKLELTKILTDYSVPVHFDPAQLADQIARELMDKS